MDLKETLRHGRRLLLAGGVAAITALALTVGGLFQSPEELLQEETQNPPLVEELDPGTDDGCDADADDADCDETEKRRRGGVRAALRDRILALPMAVRLLAILPLWLLGSGLTIFASALWTAVSPLLGGVLNSLLLLAALFGAFLLAVKAVFPDLPLKKILNRRTVPWLLLGGLALSVADRVLLSQLEGYGPVRNLAFAGGFLLLLAAAVLSFVRKEQRRRRAAPPPEAEAEAPARDELVVFDAPGGPIAIRRDCKGKQKT